ncbi:hypothetical protein SAMN04487995_5718 [Dyadobacter koreensis]|uniref:Short chain amide porin n=1 Tax=Dyadobacter koreensis TaxID=408657 RepID=A0A1H7AGH0_9BACT|nr:hypothetical protein [Dyadobacter koreensis]SEJ64679.1 hypothetical protein SAMN04487995_5718 [Dyadobacter koreensis]
MKKVLCLILLATSAGFAQVKSTDDNNKSDIRYSLNPSGSHYVKFTFTNQVWLRLNENNPGTTVLSDPASQTFDIGLRRTRMQLFGQITDRVFFYTQFGLNNFNKTNGFPGYNTAGTPSNRKVAAFFHDAVGEYEVLRKGSDFIRVGGGLTIVNGLSRFSQPSIGTIMTMDVPIFAQATVDQTDQFSRKLAIYSRGQIGKINYRLSIADPFPVETSGGVPAALGVNSVFAQKKHKKQFDGLLIYNIFDTEDNTTPGYMTGTYLGKRKVWNIEAGFIGQKNATWRQENADTLYSSMNLWSVASYLDMPVNKDKGTAVSAYLGYFHTEYGKGYLRYNGSMNPATGTNLPIAGVSGTHGNAYPMFGTGNVTYAQAGFKFKEGLLGSQGTLMPFASWQYSDYERLKDPMNLYNLGVNWVIKGNNSKLTLNYENRPVYKNGVEFNELVKDGRKASWILQYQISI